MAEIRNWTVIAQRVKGKQGGLVSYSIYLLDSEHPNHKERDTEILPMHGDFKSFVRYATVQALEFDINNTKGGRRVESYAQSFVFVLPNTVEKPTPEQWKSISADLIRATHKVLTTDVPVNDFGRRCFSNLHDQSNPHLNLLVPRIFEGVRLSGLDQRKLLRKLKNEFNFSVLKHCKIDHKKYKPARNNVGKRKNQWQLDQEKFRQERDKLAAENLALSRLTMEVSKKVEISEEAKKRAEAERIAAEKAKAGLEQAKADAERTIKLIAEITHLYNEFKESLKGWRKGVKNYDFIEFELAKSEVISKVEEIQSHDKYDEAMEWVLFTEIEITEADLEPFLIEKKPISSKVRRRKTNGFKHKT